MDGLGRLFYIGLEWATVEIQSAGITGQRTVYTGGTTADLDKISYYYVKQETALDNDETWAKVTQSAASEVTGNGTSAESQALYVFEVDCSQLSDGYTHVSLDLADTGSAGAQRAAALFIPPQPRYQRHPGRLSDLLRPGV